MKKLILFSMLTLSASVFAQDRTLPAGSYPGYQAGGANGLTETVTACDMRFAHRIAAVRFCSAYGLEIRLISRTGLRYACDCSMYEWPGFPSPRR